MTKPTLKQLQLENDELRKIIKELKNEKNKEPEAILNETVPAEEVKEEIIPTEYLPFFAVAPIKLDDSTLKIVEIRFNLEGGFELSIPDDVQPNVHLCYDKYLRESVLKIFPKNGVIV